MFPKNSSRKVTEITSSETQRDSAISVLLATCRRADRLRATLRSLISVEQSERLAKVVVIENGPSEPAGAIDSRAVVRDIATNAPFELVWDGIDRANKSLALNHGLKHLPEGLVILIDDDIRLDAKWLQAFADASDAFAEGVYFGGRMSVDHEEPPDPKYLPYMTASTKGWSLGKNDRWLSSSENCLGCNWAVYKKDLLAIGGFDENVGPGSPTGATGQESEAQRRLRAEGIRGRYVASSNVWHTVTKQQVQPDWIVARRERAGRELARFIQKRFPKWTQRWVLSALIIFLKTRFGKPSDGKDAELIQFHDRWWESYRRGADDELR